MRKYTGSAKQEDPKDEANPLSKPYLGEARVEYKSVSSMDVPPCLDWGKGDRKLGLGDKLEPKTTMQIDQKVERDTDSIMEEKEGTEKLPKTGKGPHQWEPTDRRNYQEWCNFMNPQNWYGSGNWEATPIPPQNKGNYAKEESKSNR